MNQTYNGELDGIYHSSTSQYIPQPLTARNGSSDCLRVSQLRNLNLDFFSELKATPKDWPCLLASTQKLLDELITGEDYDPLDPLQNQLKSRLRKSLWKNYVNYNDYDPFDKSEQYKSRKWKESPITYGNDDLLFLSHRK